MRLHDSPLHGAPPEAPAQLQNSKRQAWNAKCAKLKKPKVKPTVKLERKGAKVF